MSNNSIALFENQTLPAHISSMFGDVANIDEVKKVNSLSIRGKVFRIIYEGEEKALTRFNEDTGDNEPLSSISVVVLNQGPFGSRVFYDKKYSSDDSSSPKCFSTDGKHPSSLASEPQAESCSECPHAVKGSKVTEKGVVTTACTYQRRLAVVPSNNINFSPLLLRLAPTSAYDPETKNAENGWMAWRQYLDFLSARGVRHTAQLVTQLRFDSNAEHPKLLFKATRFIDEAEAKIVAQKMDSDEVNSLLSPVADIATADAPEPAAAAAPEPAADPEPTPKTQRRKAPVKDAEEPSFETVEVERKPVKENKAKVEDTSGIEKLLGDWDV